MVNQTSSEDADFGQGKVEVPGSRHYRIDDEGRISSEQVVFYAAEP